MLPKESIISKNVDIDSYENLLMKKLWNIDKETLEENPKIS